VTPSEAASRAEFSDGAASHMTSVTMTISIATEASDCHKKTVCAKLTMPPGMAPPSAMMARIAGCSADGVVVPAWASCPVATTSYLTIACAPVRMPMRSWFR